MTTEELENILLEDEITRNIDKWANKAMEVKYKDKELLALQTIIRKLQKENQKLKKKIDKLQKENKKYIDILNSTEKIMNGQERTKDKLLKENVELQKELKVTRQMNSNLIETLDGSVSKDKIRNKIKELEEELIQNYGTLGESLTTSEIKVLKELLGE